MIICWNKEREETCEASVWEITKFRFASGCNNSYRVELRFFLWKILIIFSKSKPNLPTSNNPSLSSLFLYKLLLFLILSSLSSLLQLSFKKTRLKIKKMEIINSCFFFVLVLLFASTMSLANAKVHHHEFVVCLLSS